MQTSNSFTAAALGDSITTAFNAHGPRDNLHLSWSTGTDDSSGVLSHAARLKAVIPNVRFELHNAAVAGSKATDLRPQVSRVVPLKPDYVTLLIGANDLVQWTGSTRALVATFSAEVEAATKRLVEANPRVMIFVAGIPNQAHLLELALSSKGLPGFERFAYLVPYLSPPMIAPLRAAYLERWEALNEVLADLARRHPGNVRYGGRVALSKFAAEHLSPLDSYHPSSAGQKLLAELTWAEGWFP